MAEVQCASCGAWYRDETGYDVGNDLCYLCETEQWLALEKLAERRYIE